MRANEVFVHRVRHSRSIRFVLHEPSTLLLKFLLVTVQIFPGDWNRTK